MTANSPLIALLRHAGFGALLCAANACAWTPEPEGNTADANIGPGRSPFNDAAAAGGTPVANEGGIDYVPSDAGTDTTPDALPRPPAEMSDAGDARVGPCGDADGGVGRDAGPDAGAAGDAEAAGDTGAADTAVAPGADARVGQEAGDGGHEPDIDGGMGHDAGCDPR